MSFSLFCQRSEKELPKAHVHNKQTVLVKTPSKSFDHLLSLLWWISSEATRRATLNDPHWRQGLVNMSPDEELGTPGTQDE